jgi:Fungal specific transcription factor domain
MGQKRRIGNVHVARKIMEDLWIQTDLVADESSKLQIDWKDLVDPKQLPSFI